MEHVLKGKGREIGFGPVTEILQHREKGLKLVGPLPPEVQNYTSYSAAPMTAAANAEPAKAFVRYLGSPESKALFVGAGSGPWAVRREGPGWGPVVRGPPPGGGGPHQDTAP